MSASRSSQDCLARRLESVASRPGYNSTLDTIAKLCRALDRQPGDLLVLESDSPDEH